MSDTHDHAHANPGTNRARLAIAVGITATILVAEVIGAWWTNSLALLVDAGYMLTAASGLLMALIATNLALRPPTPERTWGWRRAGNGLGVMRCAHDEATRTGATGRGSWATS